MCAVTLQWDKMRRAGGLPHLARWFELVTGDPLLTRVAEAHGPKKPSSRVEFRKEQAAAGMGGGGTPLHMVYSPLRSLRWRLVAVSAGAFMWPVNSWLLCLPPAWHTKWHWHGA